MMWVNDTLPPRARARWLLMTVRLSHSSLTGTSRTEVAVGTDSETSMFWAVRIGAPRSTVYVGWSAASAFAGAGASFGTGLVVPLAGSAALVLSGRGLATGAGAEAAGAAGAAAGAVAAGAAGAAVLVTVPFAVPPAVGEPLPASKNFFQTGSTLPG